jgi:hypothetical protein
MDAKTKQAWKDEDLVQEIAGIIADVGIDMDSPLDAARRIFDLLDKYERMPTTRLQVTDPVPLSVMGGEMVRKRMPTMAELVELSEQAVEELQDLYDLEEVQSFKGFGAALTLKSGATIGLVSEIRAGLR